MFERISNGWQLAKESWNVLRQDKELVVFPLLSGIACLLVVASFLVPIWLTVGVEGAENAQGRELRRNCQGRSQDGDRRTRGCHEEDR